MKKLSFVAIGLTFLVFLFMGCAAKEVKSPTLEVPVADTVKPEMTEKTGWEAEWEKTLKEGRKEGKVLIYGGDPATSIKEAIPYFKSKYGIALEVVIGRGAEQQSKIGQERAAGLYLVDVFMSGGNTMFGWAFPHGLPDPMDAELILPEVRNRDNWYGVKLPWLDEGKRAIHYNLYQSQMVAINTDLVKQNDIKSFYDLLDPKWKGKIILDDPRVQGGGFNGFASLLYNKVVDLDFMRQLAKQAQPSRDRRITNEWLARGKMSIALWVSPGQIAPYKAAGAPIDYTDVKEGTYLSYGATATILVNKRPHPNAARVFINWWFSKEGQVYTQKVGGYQSARVDIGTDGVDPSSLRRPGGKYFPGANSIREWIENEQDAYLDMARQIFKGQ